MTALINVFQLSELTKEISHFSTTAPSLYDISINIDNLVCQLESLDSEFVWSKRGGERKTPMTFFYKALRKWRRLGIKSSLLNQLLFRV